MERYYRKIKFPLTPPVRNLRLEKKNRDPAIPAGKSFFHEIIVSTFSAQLFVLPLLVYRFGTLSLVSPLANLAILPLIPSTMFFGFSAGCVAFLSDWLGRMAAGLAWGFLTYELSAIDFLLRLPYAGVKSHWLGLLIFIGLYGPACFLQWMKRKRQII